jgi:hypothetical protein
VLLDLLDGAAEMMVPLLFLGIGLLMNWIVLESFFAFSDAYFSWTLFLAFSNWVLEL